MTNLYKGYFIRRINRFVVELHLFEPHGALIRAYLPNPGRLWELFYLGSELVLEKGSKGSKYNYVIVGVKKDNKVVFLHTLRNNDLAEYLIRNHLIEGLEDWNVVQREVQSPVGHSRFDFLLEKNGEPSYLEVKSCSLFQGEMAMFPDAPSERGSRHLLELKELNRQGYQSKVLIIVQDDNAKYFLPEYHTDPEFADNFYACRNDVDFFVAGSQINEDMQFPDSVKRLSIPWNILEQENHNSGSYMILMEIPEEISMAAGKLEKKVYPAGFYIYVGSAKSGLSARVNRHLRKRKNMHWHIDYLRKYATTVKGLPIRSSFDLECKLADSLQLLADKNIPDFGCSDCQCESHLFYFKSPPLMNPDFIETLLYYRMEYAMSKSKTRIN